MSAVNYTPVALNDAANPIPYTTLYRSVITNDTDVDNTNAQLSVKAGSIGNVTGGTAVLQADNKTVRFTPDQDKNDGNTAEFSFTYRTTDGSADSASTAKATIHVTAVID